MSAGNHHSPEQNDAVVDKETRAVRTEYGECRSFLTTPAPIKRVFSKFPLVTYPANELPSRARQRRDEHNLYVFTSASEAQIGAPSFNPSCLKWQTLLKFHDIPFNTIPSSNHASSTGALPFLFAANTASPIPSTSLASWAETQSPNSPSQASSISPFSTTYHSLLTNPIRLAYLHALYLEPDTFAAVAEPLYVHPCSSSWLVHMCLAWPLRAAALAELNTASNTPTAKIDVEALYQDAAEGFEALDVHLGQREWFEVGESQAEESHKPGLLDAAVFAYIQTILSLFAEQSLASGQKLGQGAQRLVAAVQAQSGLMRHRQQILRRYFETADWYGCADE